MRQGARLPTEPVKQGSSLGDSSYLLSFGVGLSAANTHDSMLLEAMVDAVPRSRVRVAGQVGLASTEGDGDGA